MPRTITDDQRQSRAILLATDASNSVIAEIAGGRPNPIAYSAYGERSAGQEVATHLGFNGELRESTIGWYLLGNGYRAYNPKLMRFHSPDSWSPFGGGGLNAYMYCVGDPVNFTDPTGHFGWKTILRGLDFFLGGPDFIATSGRRDPTKIGALKAFAEIGAAIASSAPSATSATSGMKYNDPDITLPNATRPTGNGNATAATIAAIHAIAGAGSPRPARVNYSPPISGGSPHSPRRNSTYTTYGPNGEQINTRGFGGGGSSSKQKGYRTLESPRPNNRANVYVTPPKPQPVTQLQVRAEVHTPPPIPPRPAPASDSIFPPVPSSRQVPGGGVRTYRIESTTNGTFTQTSTLKMTQNEIQKLIRK